MKTFTSSVAASRAGIREGRTDAGLQKDPAASVTANRSEAALAPLARLLLATGGDERIAIEDATGRNRYGTSVLPATDEIWFSSSTATTISTNGLAGVLAAIETLVADIGRGEPAAEQLSHRVRAQICVMLGLADTQAVLTGSGTEAELIALAIARSVMRRPLTNIVVAPDETGRGVLAAAGGTYFLPTTSLGGTVTAGQTITGLEGADVVTAVIEIRSGDGKPRADGEVDAEAARLVAQALDAGRDVLLHVLDCSKSGLTGLTRETVWQLSTLAPGRVLVLVDSCQLRCTPEQVRRDLDDGFMVAVTGSKFVAGPPFSGCLLLPGPLGERVVASDRKLPAGLAAFSALADWPDALRGWCEGQLTVATNVGLAFRWVAALVELEAYLRHDADMRAHVESAFRDLVRERVAGRLGAAALHPDDEESVDTIVPVTVARGEGALATAAALHAALRSHKGENDAKLSDMARGRICHVGQPVGLGKRAVLRICASAPMLAAVLDRIAGGVTLTEAFAPVAEDLDVVLERWAHLAGPEAVGAAHGARDVHKTSKAKNKPLSNRETSPLDPGDWDAFREAGRLALDDMITHLSTLREQPVWQPMPNDVRSSFGGSLPREARDITQVLGDFRERIQPYSTGNTHPLFMGWVHGGGTPAGMLAELLAGGLNANCGGRDHVGIEVERQMTLWAAQMLDFPETSSGVFVTGTSMANFLAVLIARDAHVGHDVRRDGLLHRGVPLVAYTSAEAHGCIAQAMELAGLGSNQLRRVHVNSDGSMDLAHLEAAIASDKASGLAPFLLVGTAGSVNTGAIDPLAELARIARANDIWFHVDGAFGALAALSPALKPKLAGIEQAYSVAFDYHKWGQVPYDAGFLLCRDAEAHRGTFASPAAYLSRLPRGLAAGETWPCDLGPDLSRGFRALKAWFTFSVHGAERIGASIERCCKVAQRMEQLVAAEPSLELRAPVALNVVCFGLTEADSDTLVPEIVMDLHERGVAAPSLTVLDGRPAIRCAIVNHRTVEEDAQVVVDEVLTSLTRARGR